MNCNEQCFGYHGLYDVDDDIANSRRSGNHPFLLPWYFSVYPRTRKSTIPTKGCVIRLFILIVEISNGGNI